MEFDTKTVEFECEHPECEEKHSVEVLNDLPKKPLKKDIANNLSDSLEGVVAAIPGTRDEFADLSEEYRSNHCDMIALCTEETGYQLHCNPGLGWEIADEVDRPSDTDPERFVESLVEDYYQEPHEEDNGI